MARTHNLKLPRIESHPLYIEGKTQPVYQALLVLPVRHIDLFDAGADIFSEPLCTTWGFPWDLDGRPMRARYVLNRDAEEASTVFPTKAEAIRTAVQAIRGAGYKGDIIGVGVYRENEKTEPTIYVAAKHITRSGITNPKFTWKIFVTSINDEKSCPIDYEILRLFSIHKVMVFTSNPFWVGGSVTPYMGDLSYKRDFRIIRGEGLSFGSAKEARDAGEKLLRDNGYIGTIKKIILK